jgi:hypothetical protein
MGREERGINDRIIIIVVDCELLSCVLGRRRYKSRGRLNEGRVATVDST